ncbi:MAG TPA: kynureninase [Methylomirabilota bacterium]|nr:kynureninase [Methylomirabilota bacterium]
MPPSTDAGGAGLDEGHALALDAADPLSGNRDRFLLPTADDGTPTVYLAGQSLGAQPATARAAVEAELDAWARLGVDGWFARERAWIESDDVLRESTARLVGARHAEVATLNTLTVNLHLLLATFFRPSGSRTAILIDAPTFPSDRYAVESQLRLHGLDPARDLIVVRPREGEALLRHEDIEGAIHEHRDRLAVALLAGVNYATGQVLDIARLTAAVHAAGGVALWDLAHATGNVALALHDAEVDAAAWCTYKYLNAGPGAIAQLFVHQRHATDGATGRLNGWWGNDPATRFEMAETYAPAAGAAGWRISTPPILSLAPVGASLSIFDEAGIDALRAKSMKLTAYLESLVDALVPDAEILTPRAPAARGAQLSLRIANAPRRLAALEAAGVIADFREPDIIRMAPVPLYNTFHDAWRAARVLAETATPTR